MSSNLDQIHQFTIIIYTDQDFYETCLKFFDPTADHFYRKNLKNTGSISISVHFWNKKYTKYDYQYADTW